MVEKPINVYPFTRGREPCPLGCLFYSHSAGNSGKSFGDMFPPEVLASCGPYSFRGTGPQK